MDIEEAIQIHGADAVFTAASAGACENYEPLRSMGLDVSTIDEAEQIGFAVHDLMTAEEKAALYWEASQDLYKESTRMPEGLPTSREEQIALVESWLIREQLRRGDPAIRSRQQKNRLSGWAVQSRDMADLNRIVRVEV